MFSIFKKNPKKKSLPVLNIVLVSNTSCAGSSCLAERFANRPFRICEPTIGANINIITAEIDSKIYEIHLWDMSNIERSRSLVGPYVKHSDGVLLIFDLTDNKSLTRLEYWVNLIEEMKIKPAMVLVGTKSDLVNKREVDFNTAKEYADKLKIPYVETSAKDNININLALSKIVTSILDKQYHAEEHSALAPS